MRLLAPIYVVLIAGCSSSPVILPDAAADDANAPDAASTDFKVSYSTTDIHVWHSRDGTMEQFDAYPMDVPGYPAFGYDGQYLVARKGGGSSIDILDVDAHIVRSLDAPAQWSTNVAAFITP